MDKMKNRIEVAPDIVEGDVSLDESYLDPKNAKLRITAWIDGDIYNELKKRAKAGEADGKYQTLMNNLLRDILFKTKDDTGDNKEISLAIENLKKALEKRGLKPKKRPPRSSARDIPSFFNPRPRLTAKAHKRNKA